MDNYYPSIHLSVHLPISIYLSIHPSIYLPIPCLIPPVKLCRCRPNPLRQIQGHPEKGQKRPRPFRRSPKSMKFLILLMEVIHLRMDAPSAPNTKADKAGEMAEFILWFNMEVKTNASIHTYIYMYYYGNVSPIVAMIPLLMRWIIISQLQ